MSAGATGGPRIGPPRRDGFPAGPDLVGSMRRLARFFDDPVAWYVELREEFGDLVGLRIGSTRMVVCFDVDLLERILVHEPRRFVKGDGLRATRFVLGNGLITSDGELHRRHRKLAAPVFTPRNIEPFAEATVAIARDMLAGWPERGTANVARDCYDVSLRVAGVGLFGTDFDVVERGGLHRAMGELNDGYRMVVSPGGAFAFEHGLTPRARRMRRARAHVDELIRRLVANRRRAGDAGELGDILSRLLAARDEGDGSSFGDEEVRDEAVTMLLAGHDTTAATLAWTLSLLALHPTVQAAVREEVDEVLGDRSAGPSDLRALRRVRAAVDETLRLHPAVYSTVRDPIEPIELDGGHVLRPGTDVVVPIGGIHRDPRHWSDPLEFRPERFLDEEAARGRHRMAYIPFGTGPRICIGSSFALQELVLVVATVLQQYELAASAGWELRPHVGFIRRPAGDVPLQVTRRR